MTSFSTVRAEEASTVNSEKTCARSQPRRAREEIRKEAFVSLNEYLEESLLPVSRAQVLDHH